MIESLHQTLSIVNNLQGMMLRLDLTKPNSGQVTRLMIGLNVISVPNNPQVEFTETWLQNNILNLAVNNF